MRGKGRKVPLTRRPKGRKGKRGKKGEEGKKRENVGNREGRY